MAMWLPAVGPQSRQRHRLLGLAPQAFAGAQRSRDPPPRLSFAPVDLSSTTAVVALVASGLAVCALIAVAVLARGLRRVRAQQRTVMGDGERDLVAHATELDQAFQGLHTYVEDVAARLDARLDTVEESLTGAVAFRGLVRYDAFNEMSGRQSTSVALLDARRCGIVLSSIHHRDQARLYAKQIVDGRGDLQLSPEELEAVRRALAGEVAGQADEPSG